MAEKWIPLWDIFVSERHWVNPEKLFIDYVPDKGKIILEGKETGTDFQQELETEYALGGWHPFWRGKESISLVSHDVTESLLTLNGEAGWKNGTELLRKFSRTCYGCSDLNAKGAYLTRSVFTAMKFLLKENVDRTYWIASKGKTPTDKYLYNATINKLNVWCLLSCNSPVSKAYAMRPIVVLDPNTMVEISDDHYDGRSEERPLKIKLGNLGYIANKPSKEFKDKLAEERLRAAEIERRFREYDLNGWM